MKKIYFLISFIGILLFSDFSTINVCAKPGLDMELPHIHEILEEQAPPGIYYMTEYQKGGNYTDYTYDGNGEKIFKNSQSNYGWESYCYDPHGETEEDDEDDDL